MQQWNKGEKTQKFIVQNATMWNPSSKCNNAKLAALNVTMQNPWLKMQQCETCSLKHNNLKHVVYCCNTKPIAFYCNAKMVTWNAISYNCVNVKQTQA
jgi:hypothetical protein